MSERRAIKDGQQHTQVNADGTFIDLVRHGDGEEWDRGREGMGMRVVERRTSRRTGFKKLHPLHFFSS